MVIRYPWARGFQNCLLYTVDNARKKFTGIFQKNANGPDCRFHRLQITDYKIMLNYFEFRQEKYFDKPFIKKRNKNIHYFRAHLHIRVYKMIPCKYVQ